MADAVAEIFIEHLFSSIVGQVRPRFQRELRVMETQLTVMRSILRDAEMFKRSRNHGTLKAYMADLRELIYEADDVLADLKIRGDVATSFFPHEVVSNCLTRKKLKVINDRMREMMDKLKSYIKPVINQMSHQEYSHIGVRRNLNKVPIIGLEGDIEKIKMWIFTKNEGLNRVGILGMGGLGKTTLAQKIFNDVEVSMHFDKLIWVSISQSFSEIEILKSMLKQLDCYEDHSEHLILWEKLHRILSDSSYLIVFDDVWSISISNRWWNVMSDVLHKEKNDSSIIITTRNVEVLLRMGVVESRMHTPHLLSQADSWYLFSKIAFSECNYDDRLNEIGRKIVQICMGLPLAIKTIAGYLSTRALKFHEWKRIQDEIIERLSEGSSPGGGGVIMASLELSYDELPAHLKGCLLCFSVYPEDSEIDAQQLAYWWIGEGFVHATTSRTTIESAYDCLSDLIRRCLVEPVVKRGYDGRVYSCKIHSMVREFIIGIAREEAFGSFDDVGKQTQTNAYTRHLSINTSNSDMNLQALEGNSNLWAFLLMANNNPLTSFKKNTGIGSVKSLRVLDLSQSSMSNTNNVDDLLAWISSQKRLSYLNLRGLQNLKELPNSMKKLRNLHIFVLAECNSLRKFPEFITTLHRLIILDVHNCPMQYLPRGLGRLSNLEYLSGFKIADSDNACRLGELASLSQLRVLQMEIGEECHEIADEELEDLSKLEKLQVLSIDTERCEAKEFYLQKMEKISPPPNLEELYLKNYNGDTTPSWINPELLSELQYLCIHEGRLCEMNPRFWNREMQWNIKGVSFKHLPRLGLEWSMVEEAMPLLRYVEVSCCFRFLSFPCDTMHYGSWKKEDGYTVRQYSD